MISRYLGKIDASVVNTGVRSFKRNLLLLVAVLVFSGLLIALARVADGQVKKAALRASLLSAQSVAMVQCLDASGPLDRQNCRLQIFASPPLAAPDGMPASLAAY